MSSSSTSTASDGKAGEKSLENETPIAEGASDTTGQMARLVTACELVLLFHSGSPWDDAKRYHWAEKLTFLLGPAERRDPRVVNANGDGTWDGARPSNEATTKNLCNAVRAVLARNDNQPASLGEQEATWWAVCRLCGLTIPNQQSGTYVRVSDGTRSAVHRKCANEI